MTTSTPAPTSTHIIQPIIQIPQLTIPYLTNDLLHLLFKSLHQHLSEKKSTRNRDENSLLDAQHFPIYSLSYWSLLSLKVNQNTLFQKKEHSSDSTPQPEHSNLAQFLNLKQWKFSSSEDEESDAFILLTTPPNTKSTNSGVLTAQSLDGVKRSSYKEMSQYCHNMWKVPYLVGDFSDGNIRKSIKKLPALSMDESPEAIPTLVHPDQFQSTFKPFEQWFQQASSTDSNNGQNILAISEQTNFQQHASFLDKFSSSNTIFYIPHLNHRDHPIDIIDILRERRVHWFGTEYPFLQAQMGYALTFPMGGDASSSGASRPFHLNLHNIDLFRMDFTPVQEDCPCLCCREYTRAYICHLLQAHEMTAFVLLTFHNLFHYYQFFERLNEVADSDSELSSLRKLLKESQRRKEA